MFKVKEFLKSHRPVVVLMGVILILTAIPILDIYLVVGDAWQGFLPTFGDEPFYPARVQTVVEGHLTSGHSYFFEHRDDPPLVIFGGVWLNAIPQLAGLTYNTAMFVNFIVWSLLFAASLYWLFRELRVPPWFAVFGVIFMYIQMYAHVWRPVNMQPVYPFYFLFYIALARLIREQSRKNIILLALATGAAFYLYAYFWQIALITLGLLFIYALIRKNFPLLKAAIFSSLIGGAIGLPVPLYALWLSNASPYFWESVGRLGLVNTHLPMAEVIYSGSWVGIVIAFVAVLLWRSEALRRDKEFIFLASFLTIGGLGMWIMQGSNFITGKLLETGEHVRILILPWLVFSSVCIGAFLWNLREQLSKELRLFSVIMLVVLFGANAYYTYFYFSPFIPAKINSELWLEEQLYIKPFAWLENEEKNPIVVWSNPYNYITPNLPVFTRHFTLYAYFGILELVSEDEVRERYLVSQYFDNPTFEDLKKYDNMTLYLGRHDIPHAAKTVERKIKICRILFFWDKSKDCGTPPKPQELLGDKFFTDLENKFQNDIKPNIKSYLEKYHVSYILKDKMLDTQYHPETLGAVRVYSDDRFELWRL
ncbi:hypothetical protein HY412_01560 [Candidatus Kaiserbacteria bacterium]|nr:hypothetical protein [Candidatus Kaiserbacteria bacterium]